MKLTQRRSLSRNPVRKMNCVIAIAIAITFNTTMISPGRCQIWVEVCEHSWQEREFHLGTDRGPQRVVRPGLWTIIMHQDYNAQEVTLLWTIIMHQIIMHKKWLDGRENLWGASQQSSMMIVSKPTSLQPPTTSWSAIDLNSRSGHSSGEDNCDDNDC